jgi:hypothetical protein
MAATLQCTLHRAAAKQPLPPPPPIVLTLQGAGVTERTEEFAEFKDGQTSLGETVLSLKCELNHSASGRGYHKKEVFLAIKEAVRCAATSAESRLRGRRPALARPAISFLARPMFSRIVLLSLRAGAGRSPDAGHGEAQRCRCALHQRGPSDQPSDHSASRREEPVGSRGHVADESHGALFCVARA